MSELPDFLGGDSAPALEPEANTEAQTAAAAEGQEQEAAQAAEGSTGDAALTAEPAPAGDAQPGAEAQPHAVPLPTALDWRDRMAAAEKRVKEFEEAEQRRQAEANRPPPQSMPRDMPSVEDFAQSDPVGFALFVQRRDMSRRFAELQHGKPTVDQAWAWGAERASTDPFFDAQIRHADDPAAFVVQQFQNQQTLASLTPEELTAFQAWKASQSPGAQPGTAQPAAQTATPQPTPLPRQSLAAGPSAGGSSDVQGMDGEQVYRSMFGS